MVLFTNIFTPYLLPSAPIQCGRFSCHRHPLHFSLTCIYTAHTVQDAVHRQDLSVTYFTPSAASATTFLWWRYSRHKSIPQRCVLSLLCLTKVITSPNLNRDSSGFQSGQGSGITGNCCARFPLSNCVTKASQTRHRAMAG